MAAKGSRKDWKVLYVRLEPAVHRALKLRAFEQDTSMEEIVRAAVDQVLARKAPRRKA